MNDDLRDWLDGELGKDPSLAAAVETRLGELRAAAAVSVERVRPGAEEARAVAAILRDALPGVAQLLDRLADRLVTVTAEQQTQMAVLTAIRQDCDAVPGVAAEREAARLAGARGAVTVLLARYVQRDLELTALRRAALVAVGALSAPLDADQRRGLAEALRQQVGFTCPVCHRTSHHPEDIRQQFCGACHTFPEDRP